MKILIIGSGGREHAIAWKIAQSKRATEVIVAPGNGGTKKNIGIEVSDIDPLRELAINSAIDLTLVGPEVPLADGIVDKFQERGLKIWGPTQAAAQIEASKAFSKAFMVRHNIPTASFASFTDFEEARQYLLDQKVPVVIKASGLAAGKGVIIPETPAEAEEALRRIMIDKQFGTAGDEVVIEERLSGPEVSVLAFCDGETALTMPPAQDHKRAFDNDEGPNTGGMGAYAPAPICPPELLDQVKKTVLLPTLRGLEAEDRPYVGVLYAGLILTEEGPQLLEFNCRLGDPEAQVILPLLKTDMVEIVEKSLTRRLSELEIEWDEAAAATVVLASGGYPRQYETGKVITGLEAAEALEGVTVFHAGTALAGDGQIVTAGGRVLNITGTGSDLVQALKRAYLGIKKIHFEGMHYRTDIGAQALS